MAKKTKRFDASMFKATKFYSAEDKAWFANHLIEFIEADFPESNFTKRFYDRLHLSFGFIAHYSRNGFSDTYFTNIVDKIRFLKRLLSAPCWGENSDVERAIQRVVDASGILGQYEAQNRAEIEQAERNTLARLKAKYETTVVSPEPIVTGSLIPPLAEFLSSNAPDEAPARKGVQGLLF